ncbi:zinc finger MYM-type protein 1-like isoform X1 [Papaver somniferum]|uniref:zinc finger MYM-type protein 1-like isoform X1 n=1 Tax=Papaver somniferum TaxID=3469 RepID=UPI000E6F5475|nr:zinc finger MYM-type protein 1-like isoform X1 [Papaver somniferum]
MVLVLRYVDSNGYVQERFFDIQRVKNTCALTLKEGIVDVLNHYNLPIENIRGQGYDGANNMSGKWNGLQSLFLEDCKQAYYVHCFAHRLQLALVKTAENLGPVWKFFSMLTSIVNLVTGSSQRIADFHSAQEDDINERLAAGELETGKGANQIGTLPRATDTRWSSHFNSVCSLIDKFDPTCTIIENISMNDPNVTCGVSQAQSIFEEIRDFKFVFVLHLIYEIMGTTEILCQGLQKKTQDIVNAMALVSNTKRLLTKLREDGWRHFIETVCLFCATHNIDMPNMEDRYMVGTGHSCQQYDNITVDHHYHIDIFNATIDFQLKELNRRFPEDTIELLVLSSCLDPREFFKSFNIENLCTLAKKFYPLDFIPQEVHTLRSELRHYGEDVVNHPSFKNLSTVSELCRQLVETNKAEIYRLVDRLIRLVLTLPVSTATAERYFSTMSCVKIALRNKMEEEFLRDCMMLNIESVLARNDSIDSIIDEFVALKDRKAKLK